MPKLNKSINKILKAKIVEHFGNQKEFSRASNIDQSLVSKFIHNKRTPKEELKRKISEILLSSPGKLFDNDKKGRA